MNHFNLKKAVEDSLWKNPRARNDDYELVKDVFREYAHYKRTEGDIDAKDFTEAYHDFLSAYYRLMRYFPTYPPIDSIKRWRRKLQSEKEYFRADEPIRIRRAELAKEYKAKMKKCKEKWKE